MNDEPTKPADASAINAGIPYPAREQIAAILRREEALAASLNKVGTERDALAERLREALTALKPFAEAGGCDAVRPNAHPIRESNIVESSIWSYHDSRADKTYRLTPMDLRRAHAVCASIQP